MLYADSSALTKLVLDERESAALLSYLRGRGPVASSMIALAELIRAVRRVRPDLESDANAVLDGIILIDLNRETLAVRDDLEAIVTYDARMATIKVASPR